VIVRLFLRAIRKLNQAKLFAKYLTEKGHEVHYLANAYGGATIKKAELTDGTVFNFKIYGEMQQSYFANSMRELLLEIKPDILWILLDSFMLYQSNFLNQDTSPAKTFFWFPSDGGGGLPKDCEKILMKIDEPVAMAKFGQKQVKDYYNLDVKHIPHGTEPDRFYKLPDEQRNELRAKLGLKDKFVIGVVARNQPRKNLDRTIKAMSLIKDRIPNAILFLHMDPNDVAGQLFKLTSIIQKYNLENRVIFTGMKAHKGFDWNKMNEVFNVMDCFLLTTCFIPDTLVNTNTGVKEIKDIKIGDKILTSGKKYRKVENIIKEKHNGKILKIKPYGLPEVKCTPNHKIYTVKCGDYNKKRKLLKIKNPKIELIKANELNKLDYLLYPIPKTTKKKKYIEIKEYIKKGKNQFGAVFEHPRSLKLPEKIKLDYDFGLLCGWYLSEGCASNDGLIFTLNKKEINYQNIIEKISQKIFNKSTKQKDIRSVTRIVLYSSVLGRLFKDIFNSHCYNKKLPEWILDSPKEFRKGLLEGVWKGDGCYWKGKSNYGTFELQMVSKQLINQLHNLIIAEGFMPSLSVRKNIKDCIIQDIKYKSRDVWSICIRGKQDFGKFIGVKEDKRNNPKFRIYKDKNYVYYPIYKIEKEKYKGYVYDLTVEKEHNYVTHFLVKNSGEGFGIPIIEAMSCFPYNTKVNSPTKIIKGHIRNYEGKMTEIKTSLKTIKCTPEHPIFTERGWIKAKDLKTTDTLYFRSIDNGKVDTKRIGEIAEILENQNKERNDENVSRQKLCVNSNKSRFGNLGNGIEEKQKGFYKFIKNKFNRIRNSIFSRNNRCKWNNNFGKELQGDNIKTKNTDFKYEQGINELVKDKNIRRSDKQKKENTKTKEGFKLENRGIKNIKSLKNDRTSSYYKEKTLWNFDFFPGKKISKEDRGEIFRRRLQLLKTDKEIKSQRVIEIKSFDYSGKVYNISTESGIYFAEGMIVHNCEVPILATDYTTTQELVIDNKAGLGINLSGVETIDILKEKSQDYDKNAMNGTMTGSWEVERGICSITDCADKLVWLYEHPKECKEMGNNGRSAVLSYYDFNKIIAPAWEELLNR